MPYQSQSLLALSQYPAYEWHESYSALASSDGAVLPIATRGWSLIAAITYQALYERRKFV